MCTLTEDPSTFVTFSAQSHGGIDVYEGGTVDKRPSHSPHICMISPRVDPVPDELWTLPKGFPTLVTPKGFTLAWNQLVLSQVFSAAAAFSHLLHLKHFHRSLDALCAGFLIKDFPALTESFSLRECSGGKLGWAANKIKPPLLTSIGGFPQHGFSVLNKVFIAAEGLLHLAQL